MKNRKLIIFSLIMIAIGLLVSIIASTISGINSFSYNGNLGFLSSNNNYSSNHGKIKDSNSLGQNETITLEEFNKLDIDLEFSKLSIKQSENNEFKIETNSNSSKIHASYKIDEKTLVVRDDYSGHFSNNYNNEITIYIPKEKSINKLNIYSDIGKINIDSLTAENVTLECSASSISISNSKFTNSEIDLDTGKITSENTLFTNLNLENDAGSVELNGKIIGSNSLSVDTGEIKLNLNQDKNDTKIIAQSDMGSLSIDGTKTSGMSNEQIVNPDGSNSIEIEADMGNIEINFK